MRILWFTISCAVGLTLAACSTFELPTKRIEYKSAGKLPSLEVPPDLTRPTGDERFIVPDGGGKGTATFSAYQRDRGVRTEGTPTAPTTTRGHRCACTSSGRETARSAVVRSTTTTS